MCNEGITILEGFALFNIIGAILIMCALVRFANGYVRGHGRG